MRRTMFRLESVCGGLAFIVTLLLLPCVQTVCTPGAIRLRMNASQGMKSDCHHLAEKVVTVATCKSETCSLGGNAFNYATDRCFIKRCSDGNLKLVSDTNSDVYSLFPLCTDAPYAQVKAVSDGVASSCHHLTNSIAKSVEQCGNKMCQDGGNTFNFKPNQPHDNCNTKLCARGTPLPWYDRHGGFDVYTTLACYNDNGGCDHNCSDNGTVTSCSCRAGFKLQPDMKSCQDIDECKHSTCDQTCVNFPGGYNCSCQSGYSPAEKTLECYDRDECDLNTHSCEQLCTNTRGSYICSCQSGYKLEGTTHCMNVDECTTSENECAQNCIDTEGSYNCSCRDGYKSTEEGRKCIDVDECTAGLHNCAQTCTNTDGSYSCSCREGYISTEEGRKCTQCHLGTYGVECSSTCSDLCEGQACHADNGSCVAGCTEGVTGDMCQKSRDTGAVSMSAIIGGAVAGIVAVMVIAVLLGLWRRGLFRRKSSNSGSDSIRLSKDTPDIVVDANGISNAAQVSVDVTTSFINDVPKGTGRIIQKSTGSKQGGKTTIAVSRLKGYIERGKLDNFKLLTEEYERIGMADRGTFIAAKAAPKVKNKFRNILPYDHSLVTLQQPDAEGCNYINATYVKLDDDKIKYIASQGPQPLTTSDFWKMVWEVNSNLIVMLTNPVELGKVKCDEYWPETSTSYGEVKVTLVKIEEYDEFVRRTFTVSKDNAERTLVQYHYTSWPDHGVPNNPTGLLQMLVRVRRDVRPDRHVIVHCSAGVGRTGTFITIDQLLKQADKEGQIDAPSLVNKLRDSRRNMVQTPMQYIFIYDALLEATIVGPTGMPCSEVATLDVCRDRMTERYKFLVSTTHVPAKEEMSAALHPNNAPKNRTTDHLPEDNALVALIGLSSTRTDYINAVRVNGYDNENFIATQVPLEETLSDFWRLVTQKQCSTIVVLEEDTEIDQLCSNFMPSGADGSVNSGRYKVDITSLETLNAITVQSLKIVERQVVNEESLYQNTDEPKAKPQLSTSILPNGTIEEGTSSKTDIESVSTTGQGHRKAEPLYQNTEEDKPQATDAKPFETWVIRPRNDVSNSFLVDCFEKVHLLRKKKHESPVMVVCRDAVSLCGLYIGASNVFSRIRHEREVDVFYSVRNIRKSNPHFIVDEAQYLRLLAAAGEYMRTFDTYDNFR